MKLGDLEFHILNDGFFRLDGGACSASYRDRCGERVIPPTIETASRPAHEFAADPHRGEIDFGGDGGRRQIRPRRSAIIYAVEQASRLPEQLAARGVLPEQVDVVVNTHLHFDHCGWNTRVTNGNLAPTFPNGAGTSWQRGELEPRRATPANATQAQLLRGKFRAHGQNRAMDLDRTVTRRRLPPGSS